MNKNVFLGILAFMLMFGMILTGCKTVDSIEGGADKTRGSFETIRVPAKDFTSLGLVFAEATFETDDNGARGEVLTYQTLLKEAKTLGADHIVNVVIDYRREGSRQFLFGKPMSSGGEKGKTTWYGSATAIKYATGTLKDVTTNNTASTTTTKEGVIMSNSAESVGSSSSGGGDDSSGGGSLFMLFKK